MNYIEKIAEHIRVEVTAKGQVVDAPELESLFYSYAVLLLARGTPVTAEDVHNAWAAWKAQKDPVHPSLVPHNQLNEVERQKDEPFAEAIRTVAVKIDL